jgi:hypothetical protein
MRDIYSNLNVFDTFHMGFQINLIPSLLMKLTEHPGCRSINPDAEFHCGAATTSGNVAISLEAIAEMITECQFVVQYMANSETTLFFKFSLISHFFIGLFYYQKRKGRLQLHSELN